MTAVAASSSVWRTAGSGASFLRWRLTAVLMSCRRVVGCEVFGEALAHLRGCQSVVGELIAVLAARPGPVAVRPVLHPRARCRRERQPEPRVAGFQRPDRVGLQVSERHIHE